MLHHEGAERTDRHNRRLAGSLALVAGFVNAAGILLVGHFTSHVTGNVGRLADDLVLGDHAAAGTAVVLVLAFFAGAFLASMAMESSAIARRDHVYGALLLVEASLLAGFFVVARLAPAAPRVHDAQAAMLCAAMGLQNSLVTRLSGAVVRTTHLTGVVTDLGIEAARWFRYLRHHVGARGGVRLVLGATPPERPHGPKTALLATIFAGYLGGACAGALATVRFEHVALALPIAALLGLGIYAIAATSEFFAPAARR